MRCIHRVVFVDLSAPLWPWKFHKRLIKRFCQNCDGVLKGCHSQKVQQKHKRFARCDHGKEDDVQDGPPQDDLIKVAGNCCC
ncbi:unnamed protein product [Leptidea sinapis]|uniref:Uncharacterized protein n=1 Tax=Leptidea sinapis TaxID=189913 RepID=A0A5E4QLH9_9NEOP|nr:unnamed protein product [Leptidea sinapis]